MTKTCVCGIEFEVAPCVYGFDKFVRACPACVEAFEKINEKVVRRALLNVPPAFQAKSELHPHGTDKLRLDRSKMDEVMSWTYGPRGLVLSGPTGKTKTRLLWLLLDRLADEGLRCVVFGPIDFGLACEKHYKDHDTSDWVGRLERVDVIAFDDFGKEIIPNGGYKSADIERLLFGILDKRNANLKPTLITTNDTGKSLGDRLSAHSEAFLRRISGNFMRKVQF